MDMYRAFLAIVISFLILVGYQYFFAPPPAEQPAAIQETTPQAEAGKEGTGAAAALPPAEVAAIDPAAMEKICERFRYETGITPTLLF